MLVERFYKMRDTGKESAAWTDLALRMSMDASGTKVAYFGTTPSNSLATYLSYNGNLLSVATPRGIHIFGRDEKVIEEYAVRLVEDINRRKATAANPHPVKLSFYDVPVKADTPLEEEWLEAVRSFNIDLASVSSIRAGIKRTIEGSTVVSGEKVCSL